MCAAYHVRTVLTCLCRYRRRQATIWVDMIADDLLAAMGNTEGSDQINRKLKWFNWGKLQEMPRKSDPQGFFDVRKM